MTDAAGEPDTDTDVRMADGIEHLQRAARELIAASRAVLDVAEQLVEDPDTIGRVGAAIGSLTTRSRQAGAGWNEPQDPGDGPVERIRVD